MAQARVLVVAPIPGRTPIAVMRRIVAQLGGGGVRDLRIDRPPTGHGFGAFRGSVWLQVQVPSSGLASDYAQWLARLAVHTYRDQARRRGFRMMDGLTILAPTAHPLPWVMGGSEYPAARRRYPVPDGPAVLAGVKHRAARLGLRLDRFRVLRTEGLLAPVIEFGIPSHQWLVRLAMVPLQCVAQDVVGSSTVPHDLPMGVSPGDAYPFVGSFTVLRDSQGPWLIAQAFLANEGDGYANPHERLPEPRRPASDAGQLPGMQACPTLARLSELVG